MKAYLDLLQLILDKGEIRKNDRTGTGTKGIFGHQMRFDLRQGFPLLTTKKLHLKSIIYELFWFLKGDTNIKYLNDHGVRIWDKWADENGDLGPIYGAQRRNWNGEGIDQIKNLIVKLRETPEDRRLIVSAWNPKVLPLKGLSFSENVAKGRAALPPCHIGFQFYTMKISLGERLEIAQERIKGDWGEKTALENSELEAWLDKEGISKYYLDLQMYQRSCDTFLGVPFNIASYSLLLLMIAQCVNMIPREFIWIGGDTHIYLDHIEAANLQLTREPRKLPKMILNSRIKNIDAFEFEDFELVEYYPYPHIKVKVSI